jgi:hypothetical protein
MIKSKEYTAAKTEKYTIKQIFSDNWERFLIENPNLNIRRTVHINIRKILTCQTAKLGFALYFCDACKVFKRVYHTCKSRFCNSCGIKYAKERATSIAAKCINCKHRHLVFTIPEELRILFLKDRKLLNLLFDAASETVLSWFHDLNKSQNYKPGMICILHTFGRDMKWNPHIHALCTEGALGDADVFRHVHHISYTALRKRFQAILLNMIEKSLGKENFRVLKNKIYANTQNGFYVRAKPSKLRSIKEGIKYIVRYAGRPVMAQSRIINYDGQNITFYYERHEDGQRVEETISAFDFVKRLIIHIPDIGFKMIRYYGIYSRKHKFHDKIIRMFNKNSLTIQKLLNRWQASIMHDFKYNPLRCQYCNSELELLEHQFP